MSWTINSTSAMADIFTDDVIIWRPCKFSKNLGVTLDADFKFTLTERKSWMARVRVVGKFLWEPEVQNFGITLFLSKEPPSDWTHLLVTGTSFALKQPINMRVPGGAIMAKPAPPIELETYLKFRKDMFDAIGGKFDISFEEKMDQVATIWPGKLPEDQERVAIDRKTDTFEFEYVNSGDVDF